MARQPTGTQESLELAHQLMHAARSAEDLRAAQAVLLPLLGYNLDHVAAVVGKSRHWVSRIRNRVLRGEAAPTRHGGRRRAILSESEEHLLVRAAIKQSSEGWPVDRKSLREYLREALDKQQGHPVSESTVTAMLNRAAPHFLNSKRARCTDLEQLSIYVARIWHSQGRIHDSLAMQQR